MTLNLSKSFKLALLALKASFFAIEEAFHLSLSFKASAAALFRVNQDSRLLNSASSCALEDLNLEGGKRESLDGVLSTGEASGGSVNEDSALVKNINNHGNLAIVLSEVHVGNSARLNEVLKHLNIKRVRSTHCGAR